MPSAAAALPVLAVSSEAVPFAKSGGLADVVGALYPALRARGLDVRLLLPAYGWIDRAELRRHPRPFAVQLGNTERWCALLEGRLGDVPVYLVEHNVLYDRAGLYSDDHGDFGDNCLRYALLSRAALALCGYLDWWPRLFHLHDWQAGLVPIFLRLQLPGSPFAGCATLLTIHNLAYQGWFDRNIVDQTGLDDALLARLGMVEGDHFNVLRGAVRHATLLSTVSPGYAEEIQQDGRGRGLDQIFRERRGDLFGVLNGIDLERWDPATDPLLPRNYDRTTFRAGKAACKAQLQAEAGLPQRPDVPLLGLVTRLARQKGIDLLAEAADRLLDLDVQLVLLGTGRPWAEHYFAELARRRPDRACAWIAFDERRAHLIEAGADLFLMPSRWEPCGLNQLYSQRYGTLPLVRATGGLRDTVDNLSPAAGTGTGFVFDDATADALVDTTAWAVEIYREQPDVFAAAIARAMASAPSWARSAETYESLYQLALARRGAE